MAASSITCEADFDPTGKQGGYLRLPHFLHRSAHGWIPIPFPCLKTGDGPTLVIMAGNHGDEYEGQIAVANLARMLDAKDIGGRLILLPMVNAPAAEADLRASPMEDGNPNRLFPGDPDGIPTERIAHKVEDMLMPLADCSVDLHSGGSSLFYPATLLRGQGRSAEETRALIVLQKAFDLPYAWVFTSGGGRSSTARTAMGAANRNGVINVMAELGGGGEVTPDILRRTERGLRDILHQLGMLPDYVPDATLGTRELNAKGSVYAYSAGLFEPLKSIGDDVEAGETVGLIHSPDTPAALPDDITSPYAGIILCRLAMAQVVRGDAVFQIAADVT